MEMGNTDWPTATSVTSNAFMKQGYIRDYLPSITDSSIVNLSGHIQIIDSQASMQKTLDLQASMETITSNNTNAFPEEEMLGSPYDYDSEELADELYVMSRWPQPPPKPVQPYLTSFTKFPDLPIEIRQMIWRRTLRPRTIELLFYKDRGFYSRVKVPVALKVCDDSRKAVRTSKSSCFS